MYSLCSVPFVFSWCLEGLEVPACLLFWREPKKGLLSGLGLTALKERRQCGGSQNESRGPPGGTEDWDRQDPVAQSRDCALTVNTGLLSLEEVVHPSTGFFQLWNTFSSHEHWSWLMQANASYSGWIFQLGSAACSYMLWSISISLRICILLHDMACIWFPESASNETQTTYPIPNEAAD